MRILALDIGTKRIGVAFADSKSVRIAVPRGMVEVDDEIFTKIARAYRLEKADMFVAGLPRNNSGETTRQTEFVYDFMKQLADFYESKGEQCPYVYYQDESWTSVEAEQHLTSKKHELSRQDRKEGKVDAEAAAIILQDFLDSTESLANAEKNWQLHEEKRGEQSEEGKSA